MILSKLKVLELSSILAGPSLGSFLAELGADVCKIEHPNEGDPTRKWKLTKENEQKPFSAYYASANYGKKVLKLDVFHSKEFKLLLAESDVIISNMKWDSLEKLGLAPQNYLSKNPKKIIINLLGYKYEPHRPAFDAVLQAETGWMSMNGEPDGAPCKIPVAIIDLMAAHQMKEACLLALYEKEKTGKGSFYQVYLESAAISALANQASNYLMEKYIAQRMGSLHPNIAPYGEIVKTKDQKEVILAIGSDAHFQRLCSILNLDFNEFSSNAIRLNKRMDLYEKLLARFARFNYDEIAKKMNENRIPFGLIRNMEEVFKGKAAQEMVLTQEMEGLPSLRVRQVAFDRH